MSNKFDDQRKAISNALRDARHQLKKAKNEGSQLWIDEMDFNIVHLEATLETLSLVEGLVKLVAGKAE